MSAHSSESAVAMQHRMHYAMVCCHCTVPSPKMQHREYKLQIRSQGHVPPSSLAFYFDEQKTARHSTGMAHTQFYLYLISAFYFSESTESDLRWDPSNTASKTGLFSWVSVTRLQLWLRGSKVLHLPSVWNMGSFGVHLGLEGFIKLRFEVEELKSMTLLHSITVHMGLSQKASMDWNVLVWILFIFNYNYIVFSILKKVEFLQVFCLHFKSAWQLMLKKWFLKRRQGDLIWE